jgi:hypothetical protein
MKLIVYRSLDAMAGLWTISDDIKDPKSYDSSPVDGL